MSKRGQWALAMAVALLAAPAGARGDDGYDTAFAKTVRDATEQYRLLLWARNDGYVQSTLYVGHVGFMYTNHDRFNPPDASHPTVLFFDEAGRLAACGYQFTTGTAPPAAFRNVPADAWYDIPRHVHYNIEVGGTTYYEQNEWPTNDPPTFANLRRRGLVPDNGTLLFAFVHPKVRALIVWAWLPNADGLFSGENDVLP